MNTYPIDTAIKLITGTPFADLSGAPVDPTTVTLYVRDPTGKITLYAGGQLSHDGTGLYSMILVPAISGIWTYKWQGTGTLVATSTDTLFTIQPSVAIAG